MEDRTLDRLTPKNQTSIDATVRLNRARVGSLVNPSRAYLLALRRQVSEWLSIIDEAIFKEEINS